MTSVIEAFDNVDADGWAKSTKGTSASRAAAREQLARDMAAYEAKHGPVKTTPITSGMDSVRRMSQAIGDGMTIKQDKTGGRVYRLTVLQTQVLEALRAGKCTAHEIAEHCNVSIDNVRYALSRLVANQLAVKINRGVYQSVECSVK